MCAIKDYIEHKRMEIEKVYMEELDRLANDTTPPPAGILEEDPNDQYDNESDR
jgi:hypothetical protein